jgi:hypothetical protein
MQALDYFVPGFHKEDLPAVVYEGRSWKDIPYELLSPRFKKIADDPKKYHAPKFFRRFAFGEINGTITASAQPENCGITHPVENRRYSVRECARIQSFPDEYGFGSIPLQPNLLRGDKLHIIEFRSIRLKYPLDMLQIRPFRRQIKIHHHCKNHPVIIGGGIVFENYVTDFRDGFSVESAENLYHRLDGHVIVKEPQVGYLHQFLTDCHFPNGSVTDYK